MTTLWNKIEEACENFVNPDTYEGDLRRNCILTWIFWIWFFISYTMIPALKEWLDYIFSGALWLFHAEEPLIKSPVTVWIHDAFGAAIENPAIGFFWIFVLTVVWTTGKWLLIKIE
jgi:hypothetical protein